MNELFTHLGHTGAIPLIAFLLPILPVLILWTIFWKGLALWHSAQRGATLWFIALLLLNTLGILEIIYLFFILKLTFSKLFSKKDI